jgi:tetratricopeptide (TPR) repeat protein
VPVDDLKETTPNREFRVEPPSTNPLVAASGLSFLEGNDERVTIEWTSEKAGDVGDLREKIKDEFISRARRDVAKFPRGARAHTNLGIALINQGDVQVGEAELKTALSIDPKHYVAAISLAKLQVEQNRLDEAERLYIELQKNFPDESAPSLSLAFIAMKRYKFEDAERQFRLAIAAGDQSIVARHQLAMVLLRLKKNREAISLLKHSVHSYVRSASLRQALGVAYAMAGDRERAELYFRTALALAPYSSSATHGLARVLTEQGTAADALQCLVEYLERSSSDDDARELLAVAYSDVGQHRSAAHQLVQVFNRLPDSDESATVDHKAHLATGIGTYFGLDRNEEQSEKWLKRAIELSPRLDALPYQNLGRLYLRTDR